jgi:hypothetical protein
MAMQTVKVKILQSTGGASGRQTARHSKIVAGTLGLKIVVFAVMG